MGIPSQRTIINLENPEKLTTNYITDDWETREECKELIEDASLKTTVQIDGKRNVVLLPCCRNSNIIPPPTHTKENGNEFIILDTCSGVSFFKLLRMYDVMDWSKNGNLRTGIQEKPLEVTKSENGRSCEQHPFL